MGQANANSVLGRSVSANVVYSLLGRTYFAFTRFIIIVATARLGTTSDVGALTLSAALVTPLFFFTSMGLKNVHSVDDLTSFTREDYVALRLVGGGLAFALSVLVALFYDDGSALIVHSIIAFALVKFASSQQSLNHAFLQRAERLDLVALSVFFCNSLGTLVFVLVFHSSGYLPHALFAEATAWTLSFWIIDRSLLRRVGIVVQLRNAIRVSLRNLLQLIVWLAPIGIALLFTRAALSLPQIYLEHEVGLAALGVFGALAYFYTGLTVVTTSLSDAIAAPLRRLIRNEQRHEALSLTRKLLFFSILVGIVAISLSWFYGDPMIRAIFGPEYAQREVLTVLVAAAIISLINAPVSTILLAAHAFISRMAAAGVLLAVSLVLSPLLIPQYGIHGAAWTILLSQFFLMICLAGLVYRIVTQDNLQDGRKGH